MRPDTIDHNTTWAAMVVDDAITELESIGGNEGQRLYRVEGSFSIVIAVPTKSKVGLVTQLIDQTRYLYLGKKINDIEFLTVQKTKIR